MTGISKHRRERRRARRVRYRLKSHARSGIRLSVCRSLKHISAQIIDDSCGRTLASASSLEAELREKSGGNCEAARLVGARIAERAIAAGVDAPVFDRGGHIYHGRVRALAEAARAGGLKF